MSDIKCPACKTILSEPLPERCPSCQLEGLNRMFLTLEDYKDWKRNVLEEHIKTLCNHKISVGHDGVLVLLSNGQLFGLGNNTQGQYCPRRIGEYIDKPEKIADGVISAAAGYNYSLYLDSNGKVHFLGNSGVPYKERFDQCDFVFKKVFACNYSDIFGVEDIDGNFYVWGDNRESLIENLKEENVREFFDYEVSSFDIIERSCEITAYSDYGTSWSYYEFYYDKEDEEENEKILSNKLNEIENKIKYEFSKNFGLYENNLWVNLRLTNRRDIKWHISDEDIPDLPGYGSFDDVSFVSEKYETVGTYEPEIYLVNRYIFQPSPSLNSRDIFFERVFATSKEIGVLGETIYAVDYFGTFYMGKKSLTDREKLTPIFQFEFEL